MRDMGKDSYADTNTVWVVQYVIRMIAEYGSPNVKNGVIL